MTPILSLAKDKTLSLTEVGLETFQNNVYFSVKYYIKMTSFAVVCNIYNYNDRTCVILQTRLMTYVFKYICAYNAHIVYI